jgi:hypothetical protein
VLLYASLNTLLLILISSNLNTESALFPQLRLGRLSYFWGAPQNLLNVPTLGTTTPGVELTYDAKNKLIKAGGVSYGYDETGQLVWRKQESKRVYFIRVGAKVLGEISSEGTVESVHTAAGNALVSTKNIASAATTLYHYGHLGQTLFTTTSATSTPIPYAYNIRSYAFH